MSTTTDDMPHLEAMATATETTAETATPMSDVTRAYLIGYADAQVAELRTVEAVRARFDQACEDRRAGTIDEREFYRVLDITQRAATGLAAQVVIEGCPDWCNAHNFSYGDEAGEDHSLHRYRVEGEGWSVELEESGDDEEGPAQWIDSNGYGIPLHRARAQAMAILAGCDAIEATR